MENNFQTTDLICSICSGNAQFWFAKNFCNLYKCRRCGLIFSEPISDASKIYSEDYFNGAKNGFGYVDYDTDKKIMAETFELYLDKIREFSSNIGNLLDVGAATGYFLELARQKNWNVAGVEISSFAAGKARNKGLDVITGTLESADFPEKYFDVLTFWDVIEHLSDPKSQLLSAQKIIKNGGLIVINTPDAGSFTAKLLGKQWHLLIPPEHLIIFNRENLGLLLASCGFKVLWTGKIGKKFTLQYASQILANKLKSKLFWSMAEFVKNNFVGEISVSINLRDNIFVIARKL